MSMIISQENNIDVQSKNAFDQIEEAKRKLQESIVILNRLSKNSHEVNSLRKAVSTISHVQDQLGKK